MADTRLADLEDLEAIARVHVASWQVAYRGVFPDDFLAALSVERRTAGWHRALAEDPSLRLYVAVEEGVIAGFAAVSASRDPDADDRVGELQAIYLDPPVWGTGVGAQLHAVAIADLSDRGFAEATLWVLDVNSRARRFYERQGWQVDNLTREEEIGGDRITEVRYRKSSGARD